MSIPKFRVAGQPYPFINIIYLVQTKSSPVLHHSPVLETVEYIDSSGDTQQETVLDIEHLLGSSHNDTLVGDHRVNRLEGGAGGGDDMLNGGPSADTLSGGNGNDRLHGDAGGDWVSYEGSDAGVVVDFTGNASTRGGHTAVNNIFDVENITGSDHDDFLRGVEDTNHLQGGDGKDIIEANYGNDVLEWGRRR